MLEIKNIQVFGLERSFKASGNPMKLGEINTTINESISSDIDRAYKLGSSLSGSGHDNFMKGIIVQFDIKYPQYWTPEYQRYKFESIISSQRRCIALVQCPVLLTSKKCLIVL